METTQTPLSDGWMSKCRLSVQAMGYHPPMAEVKGRHLLQPRLTLEITESLVSYGFTYAKCPEGANP